MIGTPASAMEAERALLACVMSSPAALRDARLALNGSEFYSNRNALLWAIVCDLDDSGVAPTPTTVWVEVLRRKKMAEFDNGTYVSDLVGLGAGDMPYHLARIREAAKVRASENTIARLNQLMENFHETGDADALFDQLAMQTIALNTHIDTSAWDAPVPGVQSLVDFVADTGRPRWIVPGLLRVHDTVLLLGAPGVGKSNLSQQVAVCLAAGLHPFKLTRLTPIRTLLVDLENAPDQLAEDAQHTISAVRHMSYDPEDRVQVWPHPEGLNLRNRIDAQLLERVIIQTRPQVLCMGSLYSAYRRNGDDWDTAAEDVQNLLKKLRAKYNLALWLEHHMPRKEGSGHTGTPYGGTAWERWPTHGRVLSRVPGTAVYRLDDTFRGDRGERDLPKGFVRGGKLRWTSIYDQEELKMRIEGNL